MVVSLILFLPLFTLIIFCFAFMSYFIGIKTKVRSHCFLKSIEIQKSLIQYENELFALNPLSTLLKKKLLLAKAKLVAALATSNAAAAAQAELEIKRVEALQTDLDLKQKTIILSANIKSESARFLLFSELNKMFEENKNIWNYYLASTSQIKQITKPQLAVKADSPDLAPNYELDSDYKSKQTLLFKLQHRFSTTEQSQSLIQSQNEFDLLCGSRPQWEAQHWTIEINADKF